MPVGQMQRSDQCRTTRSVAGSEEHCGVQYARARAGAGRLVPGQAVCAAGSPSLVARNTEVAGRQMW